ncbi:unnamed protein product [marine sediment metagenome]|uniref:Uncharacterized protein n=1 Tax=marine sediment metagenome TaxID=412755 RepID=X0V0R0_9ZZZZ
MAKKKPKRPLPSSSRPAAIQFRPTDSLADKLAAIATESGVTTNEAARRLTILATHQLDVRHLAATSALATATDNFDRAAYAVHAAVDAENTKRLKKGLPTLDDDRQQLIDGVAQRLAEQLRVDMSGGAPSLETDTESDVHVEQHLRRRQGR